MLMKIPLKGGLESQEVLLSLLQLKFYKNEIQ